MSNNNFKFVYDTDEKNTKKNKEKLSSCSKTISVNYCFNS